MKKALIASTLLVLVSGHAMADSVVVPRSRYDLSELVANTYVDGMFAAEVAKMKEAGDSALQSVKKNVWMTRDAEQTGGDYYFKAVWENAEKSCYFMIYVDDATMTASLQTEIYCDKK